MVRLLEGARPDAEGDRHALAPWYILRSDDKKTARLNAIAHILSQIPYKKLQHEKVKLPTEKKGAYDDQASIKRRRFVEERY